MMRELLKLSGAECPGAKTGAIPGSGGGSIVSVCGDSGSRRMYWGPEGGGGGMVLWPSVSWLTSSSRPTALTSRVHPRLHPRS